MKKLKVIFLTMILAVISSSAFADYVHGYQRKDGAYVAPYQRSHPDNNPHNNYGNYSNNNNGNSSFTSGNPNSGNY